MRRSPYATNKAELAKRIDVSRPTLYALFKRPDKPENHGEGTNKYDVAKWAAFAAQHGSAHNRKSNRSNGSYPPNEREQSIIEKNKISAERDRFDLNVKMREYLHRVEINKAIDTANAIVKKELFKAFEEELPPRCDGLPAIEIRKINRKKLEQIFLALPKKFLNAQGQL